MNNPRSMQHARDCAGYTPPGGKLGGFGRFMWGLLGYMFCLAIFIILGLHLLHAFMGRN